MNSKELQRDILFVFLFALLLIGVIGVSRHFDNPLAADVDNNPQVHTADM
jgi:hypothetical protein